MSFISTLEELETCLPSLAPDAIDALLRQAASEEPSPFTEADFIRYMGTYRALNEAGHGRLAIPHLIGVFDGCAKEARIHVTDTPGHVVAFEMIRKYQGTSEFWAKGLGVPVSDCGHRLLEFAAQGEVPAKLAELEALSPAGQ